MRILITNSTRAAMSALTVSAGLLQAQAMERPSVYRGRHFAQTYCSGCHAVGKTDSSTLADAPPFRSLSARYPLEDLAEPLAEGIQTGHPSMPEWHLDPGDITDLLAYMRTIQEP